MDAHREAVRRTPSVRVPESLVVAIDGPSGAGKSTVARAVARRLGLRYLDTGAMYRAVTLAVVDSSADTADPAGVAEVARRARIHVSTDPDSASVQLNGRSVDKEIRSQRVTTAVSAVSAVPAVRDHVVRAQRELIGAGGIVVEGRDIGTHVAPGAAIKIFLTADAGVRARRRHVEIAGSSGSVDEPERTAADLERRDSFDSTRATSPLAKAADAVAVDSSDMTADEVTELIVTRCLAVSGAQRGPVSPRRGAMPAVRYRPALFAVVRRVARGLLPLVFRIHVRGRGNVPRRGAAILAGNHRGLLDGPLVAVYSPRPARLIAKSELFAGRAARWLIRLGQIPIDRGRPDREALRHAVEVLAGGGLLGMFPEGTRGAGSLESIQHGVAYVALRADCPIVPVACIGAEAAMPKGSKRPRFGRRIDIVFGRPFRLSAPSQPRSRAAVATAAEEIRAELFRHIAAAEADTNARVGR